MQATQQLSLKFLGPFQAALAGQPIPESRTKKIEALLIYLAMEANRVHRRESLVGLLFPDQPDEMARTNLRQTLNRLRKAIKDKQAVPPFLHITRESTQFNLDSNCSVDVWTLQDGLRGCEKHSGKRNGRCSNCMRLLQAGLDLVRGSFLDGFFLEDSMGFDKWVLGHRESLQQDVMTGLQQLTNYLETRGDYAAAETYARRQVELEPWDEAAQRQVMRLLAYQGKRNVALRQYVSLTKMLDEELGVEPTEETAVLRDVIATAGDKRPYHLPPREPIVGRDEELALIHQQLADDEHRLITLLGTGGMGKTRLAVETGWRVATNYAGPFLHGVYFVPLAGVATEADQPLAGVMNQLVTAVAESLEFTFSGTRPPQQQLSQYLNKKSILLILDNCEHLVTAVQELVRTLLFETDGVQFVITSRERLNVRSEWLQSLDGLLFPSGNVTEALEQMSAVQLFMQRALQVEPGFVVDGENGRCTLATIGQICRIVRGIPLAIELAAPWVRLMNCTEIAREIEQNLDGLTSSMAHVPERHRSMRAVFNHSWGLLDESERQTIAKLSVFRGGFDRNAAQAVAGASLSQLGALLDKSLLQRIDDDGVTRFQMQEVLRQYAAEKLVEMESEAPTSTSLNPIEQIGTSVFQQHCHTYLNFVAQRSDDLRGERQLDTLAEIRREIENIRVAWRYAVAHQLFDLIGAAADTLALFYYMRSWSLEGVALFGDAVAQLNEVAEGEIAVTYGKLLARHGWFTFLQGQHHDAQRLLQASLEELKAANATADQVYTLNFLAVVTYALGDYELATKLVAEGLAISESLADSYRIAVANNIMSQIMYLQGDYEKAKAACETSLALERQIGNQWSMGFSLTNLGRVAYAQGDYVTAQKHYLESMAIRKKMGDRRGEAICLNYLGDAAKAAGDLDDAVTQYHASLVIAKEIGDLSSGVISLTRLGFTYQAQQQLQESWSSFREALQQPQAVPQQLDALVGIAGLIQDANPKIAANLVAHVLEHPAATTETRQIAESLQNDLPKKSSKTSLEQLIDRVLSLRFVS